MDATQSLTALIDLYLLRCEVEAKSPRTIRAYRETLSRFLRILAEDGAADDAAAVDAEQLYRYLGRFTHLSIDTRHRYFREVRCFFNWLVETEQLTSNPFRGMRNVRLASRIVQPFSAAEIEALLRACRFSAAPKRDIAILMLLLDTGVRCSEAVQLQLTDLDLARRRLNVLHGKGRKQRVVPFADRCAAALVDYLEERGAQPGPLLVASDPGGRLLVDTGLQPNGLKQMLRRVGRRAGVSKVHAHRFRHTFATWAISHDARELDVQHLLGHASPDMVRRYSSSYGSEQAAERHRRFSPGDQMVGSAIG